MPKPFEMPTADDIRRLDLRVTIGGTVTSPEYAYNVNYSVVDANGVLQSNHDGSVEDDLTNGEKTQLKNIIDRLIADGRASLP